MTAVFAARLDLGGFSTVRRWVSAAGAMGENLAWTNMRIRLMM